VLPVLWGADLANPTAILATIHQTVARLGDLCKALERLGSVESDLSAQLVVGLGGISCGYYLCSTSTSALSFARLNY
jgi:hypothetical protein